jgi:hypothetical protein
VTLKTSYDFTLPRGYVDSHGEVHRTGTMRLATARDELAPLRDPTVTGPDDPRLTVLVLARVIERLGTLSMVTPHEIEGLFAVDLAFLQDFYGVINFGTQEEYDALINAQQNAPLIGEDPPRRSSASASNPPAAAPDSPPDAADAPPADAPDGGDGAPSRPPLRHAVEELPRRAL